MGVQKEAGCNYLLRGRRGERREIENPGTRDKETSGLKQCVIYSVLNFFGLSPSKFILGLQIFMVKLKNNVRRTKILDKSSKV